MFVFRRLMTVIQTVCFLLPGGTNLTSVPLTTVSRVCHLVPVPLTTVSRVCSLASVPLTTVSRVCHQASVTLTTVSRVCRQASVPLTIVSRVCHQASVSLTTVSRVCHQASVPLTTVSRVCHQASVSLTTVSRVCSLASVPLTTVSRVCHLVSAPLTTVSRVCHLASVPLTTVSRVCHLVSVPLTTVSRVCRQAAINLEAESPTITHVDVLVEGLNGQLPNLDLVKMAHWICQQEHIQHTTQGRVSQDIAGRASLAWSLVQSGTYQTSKHSDSEALVMTLSFFLSSGLVYIHLIGFSLSRYGCQCDIQCRLTCVADGPPSAALGGRLPVFTADPALDGGQSGGRNSDGKPRTLPPVSRDTTCGTPTGNHGHYLRLVETLPAELRRETTNTTSGK